MISSKNKRNCKVLQDVTTEAYLPKDVKVAVSV